MQAFLSRKFLLAVAAVVFAVLGALTGHLSYDQAADVVKLAVAAYLGAEGAADVVTRAKGGAQ